MRLRRTRHPALRSYPLGRAPPARAPPQITLGLDPTPAFDPAEPEPVPEYVFDPSLPEEIGD